MVKFLDSLKFITPTPIQQKAIPLAIDGKDLIGIAQTGTGKTLAFGIPMVQRLAGGRGMGLVVVPTRELASQVEESLRRISVPYNLRTAVLIGGASMYNQVQQLKRHPQIVIATPGRLLDHIRQRTVMLFDVRMLVLDEADRMFDMGFAPQVEMIMKSLPKERQTLLFSATMPTRIVKLASTYMRMPLSVEVAIQGTTVDKITQELFIVSKDHKKDLLDKLLQQYSGTVLLFSRTKIGARVLTRQLIAKKYRVAEIHSDRSLAQRREALEGFKSGRYRILIATDIAARGIDVKNIELVINYDLPDEAENYIHRIGRTARAGKEGRAISFAHPDQVDEIRKIERLMRMPLPVVEHPEIPAAKFLVSGSTSFPRRRFGGGGRPFRSGGGGFKPRRPSSGGGKRF